MCPLKFLVFAPCMAVRERGAAAVHQNIILGLPRKTGLVYKFVFTWCSGFFTGICLIIWILLGVCIAHQNGGVKQTINWTVLLPICRTIFLGHS